MASSVAPVPKRPFKGEFGLSCRLSPPTEPPWIYPQKSSVEFFLNDNPWRGTKDLMFF